eukprot:TRINITY_DN7637_c0_g1_i1.p1 TRINITY_DN7637_c0_g1~~TRINITY_DN7637_c0_g1_i1.p1  ORF type:complete len:224 (+),score=41.86 TRINITY_DN7637_c0_g1_i1:105-776(+)
MSTKDHHDQLQHIADSLNTLKVEFEDLESKVPLAIAKRRIWNTMQHRRQHPFYYIDKPLPTLETIKNLENEIKEVYYHIIDSLSKATELEAAYRIRMKYLERHVEDEVIISNDFLKPPPTACEDQPQEQESSVDDSFEIVLEETAGLSIDYALELQTSTDMEEAEEEETSEGNESVHVEQPKKKKGSSYQIHLKRTKRTKTNRQLLNAFIFQVILLKNDLIFD